MGGLHFLKFGGGCRPTWIISLGGRGVDEFERFGGGVNELG